MNAHKDKVIGIDLGTSNSAAAVIINGKIEVIPSLERKASDIKSFPSVIAYTTNKQWLLGDPAVDISDLRENQIYKYFKRKMGTNEVYQIDNKSFRPEDLTALILTKIKIDAETYLGFPITKAVISVPASFNYNQRLATLNAGRIAGLKFIRLIDETTAACVSHVINKPLEKKEQKIAILDFGSGKFDISIINYDDGVFEVLSTNGNSNLGGNDIDKILQEWILSEFLKAPGIDLKKDSQACQRILHEVEYKKTWFSNISSEIRIEIPSIIRDKDNSYLDLDIKLSQKKMEQIIDPFLQKIIPIIKPAVESAIGFHTKIDSVIMTGGISRLKCVQKIYSDFFKCEPEIIQNSNNCVAIGAAIQGAILNGEFNDLLLLEVTPLTLSIETLGGISSPFINKNTTIPLEQSKIFSTAEDNQPGVEIHVLQGEQHLAKDNITLAKFQLNGIPPALKGIPQIEVRFSIDAGGILKVFAKDITTNRAKSINFTGQTWLSDEIVNKKAEEIKKIESLYRSQKWGRKNESISSCPFSAYDGTEPYLFVSYAHIDKDIVYSILQRMHSDQVRIWYDDGIPPSQTWEATIAQKIKSCNAFLCFLTPNAINSENVKDEIHLAKKRFSNKEILFFAVYLEKTILPDDLELSIGRIQALMYNDISEVDFYRKIYSMLEPLKIKSDKQF